MRWWYGNGVNMRVSHTRPTVAHYLEIDYLSQHKVDRGQLSVTRVGLSGGTQSVEHRLRWFIVTLAAISLPREAFLATLVGRLHARAGRALLRYSNTRAHPVGLHR